MQSGVNRDGFTPDEQWTEREESVERGELPFADAPLPDPRRNKVLLQLELDTLREEIADLKQTLEKLTSPVAALDRSAHGQLGNYPWAKLLAASLATFTIARYGWIFAAFIGIRSLTAARSGSRF